jgi:hypothetical protein
MNKIFVNALGCRGLSQLAHQGGGVEKPDLSIPWVHGKSLYRRLLRAAQQYPSVKRDGIFQDIRADFRVRRKSKKDLLLFCDSNVQKPANGQPL